MHLQRIQEISGKLSSRESAGNAFKGQTRNIRTILSFRPLKERRLPRIRETMARCTYNESRDPIPSKCMYQETHCLSSLPGGTVVTVLLDAEIDTREFAAAR